MQFNPIPNIIFELLPEKAILWRDEKTLIVSDLHIGKGGHFRRNAIAMPQETNTEILWTLSGLLSEKKPERLLLLGDLFHSTYNQDWEHFADMLANFNDLHVELVRGNHDIIPEHHFERSGIKCFDDKVEQGIHFTHEPIEEESALKGYNLCGHIHPAVGLRGAARQYLRLPCFWFAKKMGVMPAFGYFTGTHCIRPAKHDKVFAIAENQVLEV
ncbi:MAG: ligase-associated DNA damage response endonuclease PdeM [Flavobacteriales bacterium]|nr:ligase-associated DNA damage response endonuclease PdeM [Flavobacteriales bacterium]